MKNLPLLLLSLLLLHSSVVTAAETEPKKPAADLTAHPIYSRYAFGSGTRIIDFGTQALAIPAGVITETMKRDRILKKALAAKGMEIRLHPFLKGNDLNFFLKRGDLEMALSSDMPTITMAAVGDVKVAALTKQGTSSIIARRHMTIMDLKGKKIGNAPGATSHHALLQALNSVGLSEADVKLVTMDADDMPTALAQGKVDAFCAWEPAPTIALSAHPEYAKIYSFLSLSYVYFPRVFAEKEPEAARLVLASLVRALRWLKKDEKNLITAGGWALKAIPALTGKPYPLTVQQTAVISNSDILEIAASPLIPERDLTENGFIAKAFAFLKTQGKIPADVSWDKTRGAFDRKLLGAVLAAPKKYRINSFDYAEIP